MKRIKDVFSRKGRTTVLGWWGLARRRRGVALVLTLAAVVLLTVLILAFFSRAQLNRQIAFSSSNMIKADLLARSAQEVILGELRQEMADGSVVPDSANRLSQNGIIVYQPLDKSRAIPARMGRDAGLALTDAGYSTITKVSADGIAVRPGGIMKSSGVSISQPSSNGRYISKARWFEAKGPRLGAQTILPTWLYITRDKGVLSPSVSEAKNPKDPNYVVGRFAYTVYDISGRLNANIAGYPEVAATQAAAKTSQAHINLNKLDATLFTTGPSGTINKFVEWRNGTDAVSGAAYQAYLDNFGEPRGFLETKAGQNALLSRRDLLRAGKDGVIPDAVENFTTFSRSLASPSTGPANIAGSTLAYGDDANKTDSSNRFVPNVRHPSTANIKHYKDDGTIEPYSTAETSYSYKVKSGDSLIRTRFSLKRLEWITASGPAPGKAQAVRDCFGLSWDSAKWRWEYEEESASPVGIKTLEQVANEGREPNFFELLNAGILKGSVGRDPGKGIDTSIKAGVGVYSAYYDAFNNYNYKSEPNLQIFQIGASIMDQYDSDSYPTAIRFNAFDMTGADDLSIQTVYGMENLPYLISILPFSLSDPAPPGGGAAGTSKSWLQPQLWNPSEQPSGTLSGYPGGFRAYAYGRMLSYWRKRVGSGTLSPWAQGPPTQYDDGEGNPGSPGRPGEVYFNNPADKTSPFYVQPQPLTLNLATTTGALIVDKVLTPADNYYDASKYGSLDATPNQFAAFATLPDTDFNPDPATDQVEKLMCPDVTRTAYFSLHYLGPDNKYHPYSFMSRMAQSQVLNGKYFRTKDLSAYTDGSTIATGWGPSKPDPRTDRFSSFVVWWAKGRARQTINPAIGSYVAADGSGAGGTGSFGIPYLPGAFTYTPDYDPTLSTAVGSGGILGAWANNNPSFLNGGRNCYYADPDGVVRYGDSYRGVSNTQPPSPLASGDGNQLYYGTATVSPGSSINNPSAASMAGSAYRRRPVILNRAFISVGDLGFAYRDQPFKTVDLWSSTSADAALLDLFSLIDGPRESAGKLNPARASTTILKAITADAYKNQTLNTKITDAEAEKLGNTIATDANTHAYANLSDLATVMGPVISGGTGTEAFNVNTATEVSWANKSYAESPMRAISNVSDMRCWNLLIDVVAQTGNLTAGASGLDQFNVLGERRYWVQVTMDRYTGKILKKHLEPVYD